MAFSEKQLREFKKILQERYAQVRVDIQEELLRSDNEQYIDLAGRVHDNEDESVASLLVDLNLAAINRRVREIREIEAALGRIEQGSFGICIDCDGPIAVERQRVYPTALRCHACQSAFERSHAHEAHPRL